MTVYFFETACLAKHYWRDVGSDKVNGIFNNEGNDIYISTLAMVEIAEVFNRLKSNGMLTIYDVMHLLGKFMQDMAKRIIPVPFYDEHIGMSSDLVLNHGLNTVSAIQLAIALSLPSNPTFVSADPQLLKAAEAEGLHTMNPEA